VSFSQHFIGQREEFETARDSILVWLTEMDLQLTNIEHFSECDVQAKIKQLRVSLPPPQGRGLTSLRFTRRTRLTAQIDYVCYKVEGIPRREKLHLCFSMQQWQTILFYYLVSCSLQLCSDLFAILVLSSSVIFLFC